MEMNIHRFFVVFAFAKAILLITSCNNGDKVAQEIASIPLDIEMRLFHEEFSKATPKDLSVLKQRYPDLFPVQYPDSLWVAKMTGVDTIHNVLQEAVFKAGFDYKGMESSIEEVMRHVAYYFPEFEPVPVFTVLSEVNYRKRVTLTTDALYIGIDNYLGADHELYLGINDYQRDDLKIEQLPADVALAYAYLFVTPSTDRTLLGSMVYFGKLQYLQELFAPQVSRAIRFETTVDKYGFMINNEGQMWRYLVDKSLLFDTDPKLLSRFILPAPFSKFYLEVDLQTPGGVGKYIGYRMVSDYMKNNEVSLETMLQLPAQELFEQSGYKPLQ